MKAEMKIRIRQLRSEGYGYKRIAKALDLTLSVVRYTVNKMSDEDLLEGRCEKCGIKIKSNKGKKEKKILFRSVQMGLVEQTPKRRFIRMYVNGAIKSSQAMEITGEYAFYDKNWGFLCAQNCVLLFNHLYLHHMRFF